MTLGRWVDGLRKLNQEVSVVVPFRPERKADARNDELFLTPGLPLPRYPELRFGLPAQPFFLREWSRNPPDVVHIATEGPLGWSALDVAMAYEIPCVSSFHTNFHSYTRHYGFGILNAAILNWMRAFHNRTRRTFVPSQPLIQELQRLGFLRCRLFERGVDAKLFNPRRRNPELRQSWGASPDSPVALYVGRLAPEKNLRMTIEAARILQNRFPHLKMVFVGDGPFREEARTAIPSAIFPGMLTGETLAEHYASADLFLFASRTETFGNVVTEAMASGLVVLAHDYAAPARFIKDGVSGFLAQDMTDDSFREAIFRVAESQSQWPQIRAAAAESIRSASWERILLSYLDEIRTILSTQPAADS